MEKGNQKAQRAAIGKHIFELFDQDASRFLLLETLFLKAFRAYEQEFDVMDQAYVTAYEDFDLLSYYIKSNVFGI